jgi:Uma2 family endonuclease
MTAVFTPATYEPVGQVLTAEQYDALPENSLRELVDGVIRIMASPTMGHQNVAGDLRYLLDRLGRPAGYRATGPLEVKLRPNRRRNPDVVVVPAASFERRACRVEPRFVVLAVEVVSPGSETDDRREKPFEYAEGGIPHYWRVELEPELVIHTYRLDDSRYRDTGSFRAGEVVDAPGLEWARVPVSDLAD